MKKFTNLLIVCSLALAGAVMAQQPTPEESQPPGKKQAPPKKQPAEVKPAAPKSEAPAVKEPAATTHAPKSEAPAVKQPAANQAPAAPVTTPAAPKHEKKAPANKKETPAAAPDTTKTEQAPGATTNATPPANKHQHSAKDMKSPAANATTTPAVANTPAAAKTTTSPAATTATTPAAATTPATATTPAAPATTPAAVASTTPAAGATMTPATAASASVTQTNTTTQTNRAITAKKPDQQKVQQIQQQHATFTAQPRPDRVPAVTFTAGYRLPGVEQWQGPRYEVYRSYRPERHDQGWYRSHYQRVELIAGGYYYFNSGYWYPAWGYNPTNEYYAYDAPIYAGKRALPPDKVIADVQAALQEMGYYKGEVDGLLGPLTREALTGYQRDNGMTVTAVIDEPTLESLNMG